MQEKPSVLSTRRAFRRLLGHEWDEDLDNGFRPVNLIRLSETTVDNVQALSRRENGHVDLREARKLDGNTIKMC